MTTENQKNNQNRNQAREQGGSNSRPRRNNRRPNPNNAHKTAQQGTPANKPANQGQQQNKPAKQPRQNRQNDKKPAKTVRKTPVRIIPIGGLNEIGKNMTCIECGQDMFIIDCGMAFPDPDMLGVDLVLPDYTYVEKNIDRLRGIVITHGHEDHIGGVPFFLKRFNVPIYGTRLAIGLIEGKLKEHGLLGRAKLNVVAPKQMIKMGCMAVEMIHVNHSIPDAVGLAVHTPAGVLVHTGDFKIDYSPVEGSMIDLAKFAELGSRGVLLLMSDSTNAERPGYTPSERTVGESFSNLFNQAGNRRIIVASFASNIHRIQQIIDNAVKYGRKVAVSGRSMENVVAKAIELGYLHMPDGLMVDINQINRYPHEKLIVVTTGSQGEPLSALSRMASGDHRKVSVTSEDFIIISASPIPGNEKHVTKVINDLMRLGAKVIYEKMYETHVSGHACQDELKMILSLVRPKYFMPVHGEYKHMRKHADLAIAMGIEPSHINIGEIGQVLEIDNVDMHIAGTVPSGKVFVDGLGVGDVGSIVLRDRKVLSEDGLIVVVMTIENESGCIVAGPDLVSRGFVYVRESEALMDEAKRLLVKTLDQCHEQRIREWGAIKSAVKDELSSFIYRKTHRSPMILPIIMEI